MERWSSRPGSEAVVRGEVKDMDGDRLKVLLVEDDEEDYLIVANFLRHIALPKFELKWVNNYQEALYELCSNPCDVCLLDYRLGARTGLELLQELEHLELGVPIILLTGQGDYDVDVDAMKHGASDYLIKDNLSPQLLERSIRYAISHKRAGVALRESEYRLRCLSARLMTTQEEERKRISREIHDILGSSLSAIKFGIENILFQFQTGTLSAESIRAPLSISQQAIEEVRRIMTDLRPSLLDDLGILATMSWFCRQFQSIHPHITIERHTRVEEEEIPETIKIVIFRVIQEAMNNIAKHSNARKVRLSLENVEKAMVLMIDDDGIGFGPSSTNRKGEQNGGLGLSSMKERAEISGGVFSITSRAGQGTVVKVAWPMDGKITPRSCLSC